MTGDADARGIVWLPTVLSSSTASMTALRSTARNHHSEKPSTV
jgi:hypothetical protein